VVDADEEHVWRPVIHDVSAHGGGALVDVMLVSVQYFLTLLMLAGSAAAVAQMRRWW
jgi:hypothetical protein